MKRGKKFQQNYENAGFFGTFLKLLDCWDRPHYKCFLNFLWPEQHIIFTLFVSPLSVIICPSVYCVKETKSVAVLKEWYFMQIPEMTRACCSLTWVTHIHSTRIIINTAKLTYRSRCFNETNSPWMGVNPRLNIRSNPQRVIKHRACLVLPKPWELLNM